MDLRKPLAVLALAGCLATATTVIAQQTKPAAPAAGQNPNATAPARPQGNRAQWQNSDQALATCVAIANQKEVALAQFAKSKVKNDDVKEFAEMMVKDHQEMLKKLQRFAPEATREGYLQQAQPSTGRDENSTARTGVQPAGGVNRTAPASGAIQQTAGTQPTAQNARGVDFIQLHREIANECLTQAKKQLSDKDEKEIDACFIGGQIAGHQAMLDKLTVFQRHTSGELKELLADASETTQKHLDKAEKIMKDLADK